MHAVEHRHSSDEPYARLGGLVVLGAVWLVGLVIAAQELLSWFLPNKPFAATSVVSLLFKPLLQALDTVWPIVVLLGLVLPLGLGRVALRKPEQSSLLRVTVVWAIALLAIVFVPMPPRRAELVAIVTSLGTCIEGVRMTITAALRIDRSTGVRAI
jgi:hypothetical protein